MIKEIKLFKIINNSLAYPTFYVEAVDILEATKIAKKVVDKLNNDRIVGTVSTIDIPLLRLEEN